MRAPGFFVPFHIVISIPHYHPTKKDSANHFELS